MASTSTTELEDALRTLCIQYGWSYAAYWRAKDHGDPGLLKLEGAYCEEQLREVIVGELSQVHRLGQGAVGGVVLHGKRRWVFSDTHLNSSERRTPEEDPLSSCQYLAGIKTVAIIPLPPLDVVQFGSTQKIQETLEFVNGVYSTLQLLNVSSSTSSYHDAPEVIPEIDDPFHTFAYSTTTRGSFSRFGLKGEPAQGNCEIGSLPHSTALGTSSCLNVSMPLASLDEVCLFQDDSYLLAAQHLSTVDGDGLPVSTSSMPLQETLHTRSCSPLSSLTSSQQPSTSGSRVMNFLEQEVMGMMELQQFGRNQQPNAFTYLRGGSPASSYYNIKSHEMSMRATSSLERFSPDIPHSLPASSLHAIQAGCQNLSSAQFPYHSQASTSAIFPTIHEDLAAQHGSFSTPLSEMINTRSCTAKHDRNVLALPKLETDFDAISMSSGSGLGGIPVSVFSNRCIENLVSCPSTSNTSVSGEKKLNANHAYGSFSDPDLYDGMERYKCWDGLMMEGSATCSALNRIPFESIPELGVDAFEGHGKDIFSGLEHIVGSVSDGNSTAGHNPVMDATSIRTATSQKQFAVANLGSGPSCSNQGTSIGSTSFFSNLEKLIQSSTKNENMKSLIGSFIDDRPTMNAATRNAVTTQLKKPEENLKVIKKRARPGESTRPRPKDRQLIQDRVKELREIVPNGAKCSIDALLDRTIKHMLYLQNVTKYADKLKQADEPKMIGDESGVVLRDNSSSGGGGATWAFEVAGQTMVCPIIVEDLSPPGQMLIEMLCEDRGIFLEIADIIRGFGLNILKGVMEVRDRKLWARFLVEANREVTRMEIFLSLVQLLQQTNSSSGSASHPVKDADNGIPAFDGCKQSPLPIPISLTDSLY